MKPQVTSFHYDLRDSKGTPLESSRPGNPLVSLDGSGQVLPGLEKALATLNIGDKKEVHLKAIDAYGEHDKELIMKVPKDQLPAPADQLKKGIQFQSETPDGHPQIFTVVDLTDTHVMLDGNHPLAGKDLVFNIEVVEKRDATSEELQHGHAHGGDGHHH
jgi:FKBP-type peptidyl-prolyl cis-trans isomerase SlyD